MSTNSFHAVLVTHPQAQRPSYRVCHLRMGHGLVVLQGSSCSNTLEGKTAAAYTKLQNSLRVMKYHLVFFTLSGQGNSPREMERYLQRRTAFSGRGGTKTQISGLPKQMGLPYSGSSEPSRTFFFPG